MSFDKPSGLCVALWVRGREEDREREGGRERERGREGEEERERGREKEGVRGEKGEECVYVHTYSNGPHVLCEGWCVII